MCQHSKNAASVHLGNHTGAKREDFLTVKFSNSFLTFLKLPSSTGHRQPRAASQAAGSDVAPWAKVSPGAPTLCQHTGNKCVGMARLIAPFLMQNLEVQHEVNFRSLRRKSGEWGTEKQEGGVCFHSTEQCPSSLKQENSLRIFSGNEGAEGFCQGYLAIYSSC